MEAEAKANEQLRCKLFAHWPSLIPKSSQLSPKALIFCPLQVVASSKLSSLLWRLMKGLCVNCDEILSHTSHLDDLLYPKGENIGCQRHPYLQVSLYWNCMVHWFFPTLWKGLAFLSSTSRCLVKTQQPLMEAEAKADERPRCKLWWKRRPQRLLLLCVHVPHNGCGVNNFVLNRK